MTRVRTGPRYRAETNELLAALPVDDGPIELDELVASRAEPPDPRCPDRRVRSRSAPTSTCR
jgi:hypothetical protein